VESWIDRVFCPLSTVPEYKRKRFGLKSKTVSFLTENQELYGQQGKNQGFDRKKVAWKPVPRRTQGTRVMGGRIGGEPPFSGRENELRRCLRKI
jgi:hypothetical protein